jgi:hypothetical protein
MVAGEMVEEIKGAVARVPMTEAEEYQNTD